MIHYPLNLISPTRQKTASRVVRWSAIATVLGAVCGAVFGSVFGAVGLLMLFAPSQVVSIVGYFALCGAAAGALLGMFGGVIDREEACEPVCSPPQPTTPSPLSVEVVREPATLGPRRPKHRFAGLLKRNRKLSEVPGSQDPSRN